MTVNAPPVGPVASIALSPSAITGIPGNTAQVSAALADANGVAVTGVTVSWSSSNTAVATVSSGGLVTLVKQGTATIKASAGGVTATIGATVNAAPVASVVPSPASITGVPGNTTQESAVLKDASGNTVTGPSVSWASADATIANVSSSGLVTLKKQGSTTITASDGSVSATVAVTVNAPPVAAIALSPTTVTGVPGNTSQLSAVPEDASGNAMTGVALTWTSSNTAVATVSGGTVSLVKQGTATITVAGGGVSATAAVTVNAPARPGCLGGRSHAEQSQPQCGTEPPARRDSDGRIRERHARSGDILDVIEQRDGDCVWDGYGAGDGSRYRDHDGDERRAYGHVESANRGGAAAERWPEQRVEHAGGHDDRLPDRFGDVIVARILDAVRRLHQLRWAGAVRVDAERRGRVDRTRIVGYESRTGSTNNDVQPSGYRVMFPAGQVNDAAWDMYFNHAGGTGTYYVGWKQRWQPLGSYAALLSAMHSGDSKVWAPRAVRR